MFVQLVNDVSYIVVADLTKLSSNSSIDRVYMCSAAAAATTTTFTFFFV